MVRLVCGCLNVKIHATSPGLPVDRASLDLRSNSISEFFKHEPKEIVLNLEGIHMEHVYLVTKQLCDPWTVHQCNNCQMMTHATHSSPEGKRVLVSSGLENDEEAIERLTVLPEYSSLFKVIVKPTSENIPAAIDVVPKEVSEVVQMLQMKLNLFLVEEEEAMEKRIREFQEQERNGYSQLQTRAKNDKNAIINTVLVNIYKNVSESLVDAMTESSIGSVDVAEQAEDEMMSYSPLEFGQFGIDKSPTDSPSPLKPVSRSNSSHSRKLEMAENRTVGRREQDAVVDSDDVFQYDPGFQDDPSQPPFSESDDEEKHDTDDSATEDVIPPHKSDLTVGEFSTSMPINVPQWGRQISHHIDFNDDDVDAAPLDAESMAASIQALARSIHGDSSSVFGELPTSRTRSRVLSSQSSFQH